ncbi:MAG: Rieske (2Fe-2S) protein [Gammaproteobacteria bacterium]|nr:Rieske (2Fe-2S) protein [Gammaproteobacteria bacterium]
MSVELCGLDELDMDKGVKGMEVELDGTTVSLVLVRVDNEVYAYRNRCPHTGVELNWMPDQFLDPDRAFIQCATHDARFRIEDGECIFGPCVGDALQALPVSIRDEKIFLSP